MNYKQRMREVLESQKRPLTVAELEQLTGIPIPKIRQTLTTFEYGIVRVGPQTYDLASHAYKGKTFRYTPTRKEITEGVLPASGDISLFLIATHDYRASVTLLDEWQHQYKLSHPAHSRKVGSRYHIGLSSWYTTSGFQEGDDILITCIDLPTYTFSIKREKQSERDELAIAAGNKKLADIVYDILNHSISKYESDLFLFRKYLYIYPYNDPIPPDHMERAFSKDNRFLISNRHPMLSWTGHRLGDWFSVGLRKYYFQNEQSEWVPVIVDRDEFGRFGSCSHCNNRMIWEKNSGWRHPQSDLEYAEAYIDSSFFTHDRNASVRN